MFEHLKVWVNGNIIPWKSASIPILSHGFSRGSAVFEVFGIHPGTGSSFAFRMDKHLDRFFHSAELLGMEIGLPRKKIETGVVDVVRQNDIKRGLIKLLAYWSEEAIIALVLNSKLDVAICGIPDFEELNLDRFAPIAICISKWRKISPDMIPPEVKACANYLNGYLARKDAMNRGYDLGILIDSKGNVAEGSIESVFMVKDNILKTPPIGNILSGITRMSILQAAPQYGIPVSEERITPQMLLEADEIFTSHTGIKVLPVKRIEDRDLKPSPGRVTIQVMEMMNRICSMGDDRFMDWFQPMV